MSKKLLESALSATVVHDPLALRLFKIEPMGIQETVQRALINERALGAGDAPDFSEKIRAGAPGF